MTGKEIFGLVCSGVVGVSCIILPFTGLLLDDLSLPLHIIGGIFLSIPVLFVLYQTFRTTKQVDTDKAKTKASIESAARVDELYQAFKKERDDLLETKERLLYERNRLEQLDEDGPPVKNDLLALAPSIHLRQKEEQKSENSSLTSAYRPFMPAQPIQKIPTFSNIFEEAKWKLAEMESMDAEMKALRIELSLASVDVLQKQEELMFASHTEAKNLLNR